MDLEVKINPIDQWVNEFKEGNERAFNELFTHFQKPLYYFAMRLVANHSDADEVVQKTFLQVYTNIQNFRGESSFKTWVYKIAINLCKDHIKSKEQQVKKVALENPSLKKLSAPFENPLNTLMTQDQSKVLLNKISLLSDQQKTTVVLRVFEDMPFKEIASVLQCKESTAKVHFHQAILKLKDLFKENSPQKGDLL